jgi:hypothetical protein
MLASGMGCALSCSLAASGGGYKMVRDQSRERPRCLLDSVAFDEVQRFQAICAAVSGCLRDRGMEIGSRNVEISWRNMDLECH